MLDTAGASRGSDAKELALLQQTWNKAPVDSFSSAENARAWETNSPGDARRAVVKVLYDRPAGELRVLGRWKAARGHTNATSKPPDSHIQRGSNEEVTR